MTPLVNIQNLGPEKFHEEVYRGLVSLSALKKIQDMGGNGVKKTEQNIVQDVLGLRLNSSEKNRVQEILSPFPPISWTVYSQSTKLTSTLDSPS